jgi:Rod binding domain-containing protein
MTAISPTDLGASLSSLGDAKTAQVAAALKVTGKARATAQDFETMFLNNMFQQMSTGIDGEGPFGGSGALKVWRSFLTNEYAKSFSKAGGVGIANHVYHELLKLQGVSAQ